MELKVFVYGTLKRGYGNHRLCEKASNIEEGTITGNIYDLSGATFPGIMIPKVSIWSEGTSNVELDTITLDSLASIEDYFEATTCEEEKWGMIHGEVVTFSQEDIDVLKRLDSLEGFSPGKEYNLYERALVLSIVDGEKIPVWVYHMPNIKTQKAVLLPKGIWPEGKTLKIGVTN